MVRLCSVDDGNVVEVADVGVFEDKVLVSLALVVAVAFALAVMFAAFVIRFVVWLRMIYCI